MFGFAFLGSSASSHLRVLHTMPLVAGCSSQPCLLPLHLAWTAAEGCWTALAPLWLVGSWQRNQEISRGNGQLALCTQPLCVVLKQLHFSLLCCCTSLVQAALLLCLVW